MFLTDGAAEMPYWTEAPGSALIIVSMLRSVLVKFLQQM
jgi:hypothetical protein